MTRRRLLLIAVPATLMLVGVGTWALWPHTAITRENAAKIQPGMTLQQVEAILGGPMRDESTGPLCVDVDMPGFTSPVLTGRELLRNHVEPDGESPFPGSKTWVTDSIMVVVRFDEAGQVVETPPSTVMPLARIPESLRDMLRRWLRF